MANETISFCCPACGIKLTVPASLAGVVGPCPTCRTLIQAPIPAPAAPVQVPAAASPAPSPPYPGHVGYVPPPYAPPPYAPPSYAPPAYVPPVEAPYPAAAAAAPPPPGMAPVVPPPPPLSPPVQPPVAAEVPAPPAVLKPEPRQLPNRTAPAEVVVAKQMPEPSHQGDSRRRHAAPLPRHPKQHGIFARFMMLLMFLILSAALVYGVLTILKRQTESESKRQDPPVATEKPGTATPPPSGDGKPPETPAKVALPTPPAAQPTLIEPPPPLPDGVDEKAPAMEALAVLEKFIAAKTLAERMPLIETKTPEAELAASCLANPLPPTRNVVIDAQESNPVEGVVDYFYNVDFEAGENRLNPQTMLIRTRGSSPPKVVVDPFLDLFGGRLAAFASKPTDKGADFQVIIYPLPSCTDEKIREREKKLTLKLLARENSKEIAQAYFSKVSKIGEMLVDGTYNLSYGKPKACTVMLRWNTEENKDYPYLEAIDLKALDWNP